MIEVVQVARRPVPGIYYSLESIFAAVREELPADVRATVVVAPFISSGLWKRAVNVGWASRWRNQITHVTGDILYVAPVLGSRVAITVPDLGWVNRAGLSRLVFDALWFKLPLRAARAVVAISSFTRDELVRHFPACRSKTTVIPPCLDRAFVPWPAPSASDCPTILTVGTTPNKNLERLCAALDGVRCDFHVIGKLGEDQIAALNRHNLTWRNSSGLPVGQVAAAYREAHVVVFPSLFEGFGLPIAEAQATGRPVLTSTVASMPETAGEGACLVDPMDVGAIRAGVQRILASADLRSELVEKGFENVKRFTARRVAEAYAQVYRSLA